MMALEDYFARRKQGDKINEFDVDKKNENMARCSRYITDYFETYIDAEHGKNKANPTDKEKSMGGISISDELEGYPDILTAKLISEHLQISQRQVYNLFQLSPEKGRIRSFSIGRSRRARKADYIEWLESRKETR